MNKKQITLYISDADLVEIERAIASAPGLSKALVARVALEKGLMLGLTAAELTAAASGRWSDRRPKRLLEAALEKKIDWSDPAVQAQALKDAEAIIAASENANSAEEFEELLSRIG